MDLGYDIIFTLSGMVLVFLILVLLMVIIKLEGSIFDAVSGKKRKPKPAAPAAAASAGSAAPKAKQTPPAAAPAASAAPAQPQVERGIPGEVVAAIMAAVYAMGNGKYKLKAVRRGSNGWSRAGINDATAPF